MKTLSWPIQIILFFLSLFIVGFGQPAWSWWTGLIAAAIGYAIFWHILLAYPRRTHRFLLGAAWFMGVQLVQLSWAISHPYFYIYFIYPFFSLLIGLQFGILCLFITPSYISRISSLIFIASIWTLFEWSRLFFFSGYSWNPVGLALTGAMYPMQIASLWGVFGLSFWVMFVNLLALKMEVQQFSLKTISVWLCALLLPYLYGTVHINFHRYDMAKESNLNVVLVQTAFAAEESSMFQDHKKLISHVIDEWKQILAAVKKQQGKQIDLIVLPEYTVPCGTYTCVFPYSTVEEAFIEILGKESLASLPSLEQPFAWSISTTNGTVHLVNNAFWVQAISNIFNTGVVIGLEDADVSLAGEREHYSAAIYFRPRTDPASFNADRYEKRVLVPMGEYIPFEFCRAIAAEYGIQGSFTSGKEAKVFTAGNNIPFGLSICYEETFGDLMRENKQRGATLLVNLTSGAWYPNSRLPWQHFTHARLRTVESGIPLIRSSNLGITGVVDSLGYIVSMIGEEKSQPDRVMDSLYAKVPIYNYPTVYSHLGDSLIVGFCFISILFGFRSFRL